MIQTMRTGTVVQSGETTGCIGCHEDHRLAPKNTIQSVPTALRREPDKLKGWYGPAREFNYLAEVQPVFDKHCVRCHDYGGEGCSKLNLARDITNVFNTSYTDLWRKAYIKAIGAGTAELQYAYSWGAHVSKLIDVILSGHNDVKLSDKEFEKIVTWIDLNGPYYPYFSSAYPNGWAGRSPLNGTQIARLRQLTKAVFAISHKNNPGVQLSFDRPELSLCLRKFNNKNDPKYIEALSIIQAGKEKLAQTPRAEMPGFVPGRWHQQVQTEYNRRQKVEFRNRVAILNGQKLYDKDLQ